MRRENPIRQLMTVLASVFALGLVVSCSGGFNQDPLADQPEDIRKAKAPGLQKPKPTATPVREEVLRIDADNYFSFREGEENEYKLTGRYLMPVIDPATGEQREAQMGRDLEFTIENIADFPEAAFDKTTGKFKWVPPHGYVKDLYTRNARLVVSLSTLTPPIYTRRVSIPVYVSRKESEPDIIDIQDISADPLIEGGPSRTMKVTVWDPDGADLTNMRPRLMVLTGSSGLSGAHLVRTVGEAIRDQNEPKRWHFNLVIQGGDQEITRDKSFLNFGLIAVTRFGRSSVPKSARVQFITNVSKPVIGWTDGIEVRAGETATIAFTVADVKKEGLLSTQFTDCATSSRSCVCVDGLEPKTQVCTVTWAVPPSSYPYTSSFVITAENRHPIPGISLRETISRKATVKVLPSVVPTPSPAPNPAPNPNPSPLPIPGPSSSNGGQS